MISLQQPVVVFNDCNDFFQNTDNNSSGRTKGPVVRQQLRMLLICQGKCMLGPCDSFARHLQAKLLPGTNKHVDTAWDMYLAACHCVCVILSLYFH